MNPKPFYDHYRENGFIFSKSILTRYCLSLFSKPFVILSGISGTGKTKIAQLFNVLNEDKDLVSKQVEDVSSKLKNNFIILNITKGLLENDGRANFKFSDIDVIYEPDEIIDIKAQIAKAKSKGGNDNITEPIKIKILEEGVIKYIATLYLQRASSPLLRLRFKAKTTDPVFYNSMPDLQKKYKVGDVLKLVKTGIREFTIETNNDPLVVEANRIMDSKEATLIDNKLFVSVKSNWTDSSEIFGYYNILNEKYQMTDILRFMLRAQETPKRPFFLILDEMNLSRIEHYFSDYLSSLESRHWEDGVLKQEPISLHNFSSYVDSDDDYFDIIPNKLLLPTNLYVTGTVNIDESTYSFSPKVLDRANVIEFNEVNLNNYTQKEEESIEKFVLAKFPDFGEAVHAGRQDYIDAPEAFGETIAKLIEILQPYNLHFGYRAINEMALFINNVSAYVSNEKEIIEQAIDFQVSQKILPKFSGAFGKLDEPIRKLINFLASEEFGSDKININTIKVIDVTISKYPVSLSKLISMYKSLLFNGFVSYLG